jgi:serine/threonine protein kinase
MLALDIARGMAWLHMSIPPIIHKDLKPTNIMIDANGHAKIIDFGLSEVQKEKEMQNRQGAGSLAWMSPEMLEGKNYTEKIDVYAYAIILCQLFTGSPEVYDITRYKMLNPVIAKDKFTRDIVDFKMRPAIPASFLSAHGKLSEIMEEAWEKDHTKRPSFRDILDRLSPCSLSYALNDDNDAIKMWSKHFSDKTSVPVREFLSALWKATQKSEPPDPYNDGYINLKCIKAVILPLGTNRDTVTLRDLDCFYIGMAH